MKNSFQRATTSSDRIEENKKRLKAFRSEIYSNIEKRDKKKNAFTINKENANSISIKSKDDKGENRDDARRR